MNAIWKKIHPYAVISLTGLYCALVLLNDGTSEAKEALSPLAYVALILAALYWGRKGGALVFVFVCTELISEALNVSEPEYRADVARMISFFIVVVGLGAVRDNAVAATRERREFERKYHDIVEKSLQGIFVYRNDRFVYTNPRFRELLEVGDSDLIGTTFWTFVHDKDKPKVRGLLKQRESGLATDLHYECRLLSRGDRVLWADIISSPVKYEGEPAVLVSVYDITQHKEREERDRELERLARRQEEQLIHSTRLAEMGEMAAGIAHELNQPLTGIKNYAKNALYMIENEQEEDGGVKNNLQLISAQVDRAARIIGQMRELARRAECQSGPVDINQRLGEALDFVVPQMRLAGVEVTLDLAQNLPPVMGDGLRLEQVFLNLLVNARQAMEESAQRRLAVSTRHDRISTLPVIVEIADTGKGFSDEVAPRLFAPFYTTKESGQGTGLGLSISMNIIQDHQGTIEARGEPGKGAIFTVRLPAQVADRHSEGDPDTHEKVYASS